MHIQEYRHVEQTLARHNPWKIFSVHKCDKRAKHFRYSEFLFKQVKPVFIAGVILDGMPI